ncbi:MAG: 3-hydroxyacyl-CoA dehydrogenase family protein [Candidatus Taylorbacteria bacterium]|nr:3-hydroxyacyl-CoA dehydrogenase family protein [Candidatus Taylorbacteria bacterium]
MIASKPISKVAIVGAGTMGRSMAVAFSLKGVDCSLFCRDSGKNNAVRNHIGKIIERLGKQEKIDLPSAELATSCIHIHNDMAKALESAQLVIEAVSEDLIVKRTVHGSISEIIDHDVVVTSNTSSIPISEIFQDIPHSSRFAGFHFFNPAHIMPFIEIVPGERTSQETIDYLIGIASFLEKDFIISKDTPGFTVNRILFAMFREAISLNEGGVGKEDIDKALKKGCGFPMGPFELLDFIGLDVANQIFHAINKNESLVVLDEMIQNNNLGKKTKHGFYQY